MKVPGQNGPRPTSATSPSREAHAKRGESSVGTPLPAAKASAPSDPAVVVSQSASKVSDLERAEEAQHAARVDELRAKVESGEYEVDKDRLADRMAEEELARAPK